MTTTLLTARTATGESDPVGVTGGKLPYTFHAAPPMPGGGKKATIEYLGGDNVYYPLWIDGFVVQLDATRRKVSVFTAGKYRVRKDTTDIPVGIYGEAENEN